MCKKCTLDGLEVLVNKIVSAHTDYKLADDAFTFDQFILAAQDCYVSLMEQRAKNTEQARKELND